MIAKRAGAATGLLTCARLNAPEDCDHLITLATGPAVVTGSTRLKAGTATKIALNTITTTLFVRLGKVYGNLMVDVRATNAPSDDDPRIIAIVGSAGVATKSPQGIGFDGMISVNVVKNLNEAGIFRSAIAEPDPDPDPAALSVTVDARDSTTITAVGGAIGVSGLKPAEDQVVTEYVAKLYESGELA